MLNFLQAKWENIIMANYEVPISVLQPYLPKGTQIDSYEGKAYVSLVGFLFKETRLFKIAIPKLGTFEEINLRFYVYRKEGDELKRGVVFINETVPYKAVAWLANKLYKEHYRAVKTKYNWETSESKKQIHYQWLVNNKWNLISVEAEKSCSEMQKNSFEEFIFEHYYGYNKLNSKTTIEYSLRHPRWQVYQVKDFGLDCDVEKLYGASFVPFIQNVKPVSVFLAKGSDVKVKMPCKLFK